MLLRANLKGDLIALFIFVCSFSVFAADPAESPEWLRLVHYQKTWFGYESQADGTDFFLATNGKNNPAAELSATFAVLESGQLPSTHAYAKEPSPCLFPARWAYLKKQFPEKTKNWVFPKCERFDKFLSSVEGDSVSLIFSSYYLNSPSSSFGHTFIRFNKTSKENRSELLDFGINYAATMGSNFIVTNLGGLAGYLPGTFSSIPYYYKVQEYSNVESRDLWEYELNLTSDEVRQLARHFWELGHTYFDYYYLTENCSYHMLSALEAAAPRLNLISRVPFYVIPIDTVKAVSAEPGLLKQIRFRPSKRTQLEARLNTLNSDEKSQLRKYLNDLENPQPVTATAQELNTKTLDTAIDYWDYRYYEKLLHKDAFFQERKSLILQARAQRPEHPENLETSHPLENAPHKSHASGRSAVGVSFNSNGQDAVFNHRFALHDLQDIKTGYPPLGEIEFFNFQLRWLSYGSEKQDTSSRLRLDHFYPASVKSFDPIQQFIPTRSWSFRFGAERMLNAR